MCRPSQPAVRRRPKGWTCAEPLDTFARPDGRSQVWGQIDTSRMENGLMTADTEVYYDPYDFEIDNDPYPVWRRLREEAPLYYNGKHDFYALSRFQDVEQSLTDWNTFSSAKGMLLEIIKAVVEYGVELPPGNILFEDPPIHDVHRGILSRVFSPKRMLAIEPKVREFCAQTLDPLVGSGGFDFITGLGPGGDPRGDRREPRPGEGRRPQAAADRRLGVRRRVVR